MLTYNTNSKTGPVCGGRALCEDDDSRVHKDAETDVGEVRL